MQSSGQHGSRQSTYFDSDDDDKTNLDTPNSHSDGNTPSASRGAPVKRRAKAAKRVVNPMLAHALVVARSEVPRVPKPQSFVAPIPHPPNFASDLAAGALLAMSASLGPAPKLLYGTIFVYRNVGLICSSLSLHLESFDENQCRFNVKNDANDACKVSKTIIIFSYV